MFKEALSETYSSLYGRELDPEKNICVATGGSEAILASIMAFIEPGDEVIIIEPVFELYVSLKILSFRILQDLIE